MTWVAVAVAGAAVVGGVASNQAADKAADATADATYSANQSQAQQSAQTRADFAPQRELGHGATSLLGQLYGINVLSPAQRSAQADVRIADTMLPAGTTYVMSDEQNGRVLFNGQDIGRVQRGGKSGRFIANPGVDINALRQQAAEAQAANSPVPGATNGAPSLSAFIQSPDYQFNLAEGQKAMDRSLTARGRGLSGAAVREGTRYASGMASQQYGDFTNRLMQIAGLGSAATSQTAAAGANAANNISQNTMFQGAQRASGYQQNAANINNTVQSGISNWMLNQYLNPGAGGTSTNIPMTGGIGGGTGNWSGPR